MQPAPKFETHPPARLHVATAYGLLASVLVLVGIAASGLLAPFMALRSLRAPLVASLSLPALSARIGGALHDDTRITSVDAASAVAPSTTSGAASGSLAVASASPAPALIPVIAPAPGPTPATQAPSVPVAPPASDVTTPGTPAPVGGGVVAPEPTPGEPDDKDPKVHEKPTPPRNGHAVSNPGKSHDKPKLKSHAPKKVARAVKSSPKKVSRAAKSSAKKYSMASRSSWKKYSKPAKPAGHSSGKRSGAEHKK